MMIRAHFAAVLAFTVAGALSVLAADAAAQTTTASPRGPAKARILVHITHGPEHPTRAALGFLVARTALDEGHAVTLFLAGDAVQLLRDAVLDSLAGQGTGRLREQYDVIVARGGRFYLSGQSSNVRGITEGDLKGKPAEFAPPAGLIRLSLEHDRMFTY